KFFQRECQIYAIWKPLCAILETIMHGRICTRITSEVANGQFIQMYLQIITSRESSLVQAVVILFLKYTHWYHKPARASVKTQLSALTLSDIHSFFSHPGLDCVFKSSKSTRGNSCNGDKET
ncbi:hypothetical protein ABG067_003126, partial [Albugo candida]